MNVFQKIINKLKIANLPAINHGASLFYTLGGIAISNDRFSSCVFACVDAIVSRCIMTKLKLVHYNKNGEAQRSFNHRLLEVLCHPNPQQTWTDLIKWTVGHRETKGTAYWWLQPALDGKNVAAIRVLTPERVDIIEDDNGNIGGYVFTTSKGQQIPFSADEVISFPYFNPSSQLRGVGPLQAARLSQENDLLAQSWNNKLFKNGALPSGVLQTDQKLTEAQYNLIRQSWQSRYAGEENMAKTAILEAGLKYERLSLSQADLAFYEGRRDAREEIMMIFRVPKAALGMTEGVNRASAEATLYAFAELKIQPMMEEIFVRINEFVLPKFGLNPRQDVLEFNSLVPENREQDLKEHTELMKNSAMTINEVRSRRGLSDVSWGNEPYHVNKAENEPFSQDVSPEEKDERLDNDEKEDKVDRAIEKDEFNHKKYRKNVDKLSTTLEREFVPKIKASHEAAQKTIIEHLIETGKQRGLFGDLNPIQNKLLNTFLVSVTAVLTTSYYRSGKIAIKYLGINDGEIKLDNSTAVNWITKHALEDATSVVATLRSEIAPLITAAITKGLSTYELTQKLTQYFKSMTDWKARQIAHTEIHKGLSAAAHIVAEATGRELWKCWSDSGDDRVCETCQENSDAGYIPMKETYPSGAMHPEESHPNCRCREYFEPTSRHKK